MKQKTFELDQRLAGMFEEFCKSRMLIEKRAAAAALFSFMKLDANERESAILSLERWLEADFEDISNADQEDESEEDEEHHPAVAGKVRGRDMVKRA